MSNTISKNKQHWYDGIFYDKIIAPNQKNLFKQIIDVLKVDSSVLDVGCGTGLFSFSATEKCESVLGIDLSIKNIEKANSNLQKKINEKLLFEHTTIDELIQQNKHFDYAVMTYVIHEVNEEERIPLLNAIAKVTDIIIIGDYLIPQPRNYSAKMTEIIEFLAGREHYQNFKNYERNGGIHSLAKKAGLNIQQEIINETNTILVLSK